MFEVCGSVALSTFMLCDHHRLLASEAKAFVTVEHM